MNIQINEDRVMKRKDAGGASEDMQEKYNCTRYISGHFNM